MDVSDDSVEESFYYAWSCCMNETFESKVIPLFRDVTKDYKIKINGFTQVTIIDLLI